jgi:hypothetical protein
MPARADIRATASAGVSSSWRSVDMPGPVSPRGYEALRVGRRDACARPTFWRVRPQPGVGRVHGLPLRPRRHLDRSAVTRRLDSSTGGPERTGEACSENAELAACTARRIPGRSLAPTMSSGPAVEESRIGGMDFCWRCTAYRTTFDATAAWHGIGDRAVDLARQVDPARA